MSRRRFAQHSAAIGAGLALAPGRLFSQPSERVRVAVMGIRSRGRGLAGEFAAAPGCEVVSLIDVDQRYFAPALETVAARQDGTPSQDPDLRRVLERSDVDALVVAAPDHWHAPAAMMALDAGKHVYLEKPCSHNPREGELLIAAQHRHPDLVLHMGNQRRSWTNVIRCIDRLREGMIGKVYFAKGWYANRREAIGTGKEAPVPEFLDWELWQGPAPRTAYRDNVHPYNWHWFRRWGTGEALNNGTHEIDVMRWGMGVDYPTRVVAAGGRWHYRDDWQFPDTMVLSYDFADGRTMTWESRSSNGHPVEGWGRGVLFHGEKGTVLQVHDGYVAWANDEDRSVIERIGVTEAGTVDSTNTTSPDASLDGVHVRNFLDAVRGTVASTSPIDEAHKSVLLCQLGNIAWQTGRTLDIDAANGHVQGDPEAQALWRRDYEPGWEPSVGS